MKATIFSKGVTQPKLHTHQPQHHVLLRRTARENQALRRSIWKEGIALIEERLEWPMHGDRLPSIAFEFVHDLNLLRRVQSPGVWRDHVDLHIWPLISSRDGVCAPEQRLVYPLNDGQGKLSDTCT